MMTEWQKTNSWVNVLLSAGCGLKKNLLHDFKLLILSVNELTRDREQQDRTQQYNHHHDLNCVEVFMWTWTGVCFTHQVLHHPPNWLKLSSIGCFVKGRWYSSSHLSHKSTQVDERNNRQEKQIHSYSSIGEDLHESLGQQSHRLVIVPESILTVSLCVHFTAL